MEHSTPLELLKRKKMKRLVTVLLTFKLTVVLAFIPSVGALAQQSSRTQSTVDTTRTRTSSAVCEGRVMDSDGQPLIGAVVSTNRGQTKVTTDIKGFYSIRIPSGMNRIHVSYIGYVSQDLAARGGQTNVVMREDEHTLRGVVVTALGIKRKAESLTYATQTVGGDELTRAKDANLINSLQGKSAGLIITPNSTGAGSASKILLRGNASMLGNNSPLIVLDGVPMPNPQQNQLGLNGGANLMTGMSEGGDALSQLNPDDIENITVLKGANAAALYGSAAANGVLMITTKKGKSGQLRIDLSSSTMFEQPLVKPKLQNVYGSVIDGNGTKSSPYSIGGSSWGGKLSDMTAAQLDPANSVQHLTNQAYNIDNFFRTGVNSNNTIALSGGSEKIQNYFSYGHTQANGIVDRNTFQRNNLALRETFNFFQNRLKLDIAGNYVNEKTKNRPESGMYSTLANLYTAARNADMNYYKSNYHTNGSWTLTPYLILAKSNATDASGNSIYALTNYANQVLTGDRQVWYLQDAVGKNNPWWLVNRNPSTEIFNHVFGNVNTTFELYKDLNVQTRIRYDYQENRNEARQYATTMRPSDMNERGRLIWSHSFSRVFYGDFLFNYSHNWGEDWSLHATFGGSMMNSHANSWSLTPTASSGAPYQIDNSFNQFILSNIYINGGNGSDITGGGLETKNWERSLFATAQVSYKSMANLEASWRSDWYRAFTQFPDLNKSYPYFSVGGNVLLNKMVKMPTIFDELKVRGSYSVVGNSIPNNLFLASASRNPATGAYITSGTTDFKNAKPETTNSGELGFDLSMFNRAFNMDFTFYNAVMCNQFMSYAGKGGKTVYTNSGKVRNRGIEITASYTLVTPSDFTWRTGVNFSYNVNKIITTAKKQDGTDLLREVDLGNGSGLKVKFLPGGSYGDLYATDYVRNEDGSIKINKTTGRPFIDQANATKYLGNMNAKVNLGWNNTFSYKNFSLYLLVDGKIGGKVVSFTEAFLDYYGVSQRTANARLNAEKNHLVWTNKKGVSYPGMYMEDGNLTSIEAYYTTTGGPTPLGANYVYNGTNFRMREISASYTFKNVFGPTKNLTMAFTARNLFFIYKDAPIDPETSLSTQNALGNVDVFSLPTTRSFGVTLKATF
jgi:TonB-linked SusC/RagA family outer membrane protein